MIAAQPGLQAKAMQDRLLESEVELSARRQDLTGFDDGGTLKALHGRAAAPRPPRSPMRASASHPDPAPTHSVDPPPFMPCLSSPPDISRAAIRGAWAAPASQGGPDPSPAARPAARSAEAPPAGRWARARSPAPLQEGFEGFSVQPPNEVRGVAVAQPLGDGCVDMCGPAALLDGVPCAAWWGSWRVSSHNLCWRCHTAMLFGRPVSARRQCLPSWPRCGAGRARQPLPFTALHVAPPLHGSTHAHYYGATLAQRDLATPSLQRPVRRMPTQPEEAARAEGAVAARHRRSAPSIGTLHGRGVQRGCWSMQLCQLLSLCPRRGPHADENTEQRAAHSLLWPRGAACIALRFKPLPAPAQWPAALWRGSVATAQRLQLWRRAPPSAQGVA